MYQIKYLYIALLIIFATLQAMGEKPGTRIIEALDTFSSVQYHAVFATVSENATALNKDTLRAFVADFRRPEFPVNTVFLTTPTENISIITKALHNSKIQAWYVVRETELLEQYAIELENSGIDGILLLSKEPLPLVLKALENTKITLAQKKSDVRLGCTIPAQTTEDDYQIFNTINLAVIPSVATDPLAIAKEIEPLLNYANELHTSTYIALTAPGSLQQSTPAQLSKYISFLNSVIGEKKYKGLCLTTEDLDSIWHNKKH